jgi:putative glycosyltransferase (TIGR04348 family)
LRASNAGNWHTAARWARFLRPDARVRVQQLWDGQHCDAMIALHARRSANSIAAFRTANPQGRLAVVLTGTDLYADLPQSRAAQRSLDLADQLVVLQALALDALPRRHRTKTRVIHQSATSLRRTVPRGRTFVVAVVGHLRDVKDPATVMRAARLLPADSRVRLLHAGAALSARYAVAARRTEARTSLYRWLDDVPRARARRLMQRSALLLHPSKMEGGAQVIIEALRSGTPVLASDADGNVGLLGRGYPGLFPVGDARRVAQLLERAAREPTFLKQLDAACRARAPLFAPHRERAAVRTLVRELLHNRP